MATKTKAPEFSKTVLISENGMFQARQFTTGKNVGDFQIRLKRIGSVPLEFIECAIFDAQKNRFFFLPNIGIDPKRLAELHAFSVAIRIRNGFNS